MKCVNKKKHEQKCNLSYTDFKIKLWSQNLEAFPLRVLDPLASKFPSPIGMY